MGMSPCDAEGISLSGHTGDARSCKSWEVPAKDGTLPGRPAASRGNAEFSQLQIDVRVIAATNQDLGIAIRQKPFRAADGSPVQCRTEPFTGWGIRSVLACKEKEPHSPHHKRQ